MMDDRLDETSHDMCLQKFDSSKKYKEQILQEIVVSICAMLNSSGGKVVVHFETDAGKVADSKPSSVIRILEQHMISIIGGNQTVLKIDFEDDEDNIIISIKKADFLITNSYNLYLPSVTQVVAVSPLEPIQNIKKDIMYRQAIPNPVELVSHCQIFRKDEKCGFFENKMCQFKNLKSDQSKRTTLADRITCKGNKFRCYISAFANYSGGHIFYGITDDGVVEGEFIRNEEEKEEITKKVDKVIKKMIWPGQPISHSTRGKDWEILFKPIVDGNSKPVPSTFVIVIYIAPCLGGVFTEEPESYEFVDGKAQKLSFDNWKKRIPQPVCCKAIIPHSIPRITWSSDAVRKTFAVGSEKLRKLINNGDWDAFSKECENRQKQSHSLEVELLVLSKRVTARYRRGHFNEAHFLLEKYMTILPEIKDVMIFEVVGLHLQAALKRATGDSDGLKEALTAALSKAEQIEPGLVTTTVYAFAAIVSDLINLEEPTSGKSSPDILSKRALEHSQRVKDCPDFYEDKAQKVHIMLATYYLGCNLSGQLIKDNIDKSDLDKAGASIVAVHQSDCGGNPPSKYRKVQLKLVQSINSYRNSQISPEKRVKLLRSAFDYAKEAERLSKKYKFTEMLQWSKRNEALCTEELVRTKFASKN